MVRYQILIEYVGTLYEGWQIQKKGKTVQGLIQTNLTKLLKENITLVGSGRTDAGVHAEEQSAHFDCTHDILNLDKFLKSINHFLNKEQIAILKIKKKSLDFHSRFSAKHRIYKYIIFNRLSAPAINSKRGWHVIKKLDLSLMKLGAKKLIGKKDFSTFRASSCNARSPIKTMTSVKVLIGLLALQLDALKVEKSFLPISFLAPSFIKLKSSFLITCQPLLEFIAGALSLLKMIYLYILCFAENLE